MSDPSGFGGRESPVEREADPAWKAMILKVEDLMRERNALLASLRQTLSLQSLAEAVGTAPDLATLLDSMADVLGRVLPWKGFAVFAADLESLSPQALFERSIGEDDLALVRTWIEDGIIEWVFQAGKPVSLPGTDSESCWILMPLLVLGRPVGWMILHPVVPVRDIASHHLETLAMVGAQAAATLDNLAQRGKLQASLHELESLYDVGSRIGSSLDLGEIFQVAADAVLERFQPQSLLLAAVDAGVSLKIKAMCTRGTWSGDASEDDILHAACRRVEPVQICRGMGNDKELDRQQVDLLVAVPFVHRGTTVLGGLVVGARNGSRLEAPEALNWLTALAGLLSASLENARLYEDLLAVNERLSTMQSRLVQAGRISGIGQLAGGIAHEINNPLQVVMGRLQILQMKIQGNESAQAEVTRIDHEVKRIARIVRGIQDFSHQSRENAPQETVHLVELCESTLQILEHRIRKSEIVVEREGFGEFPRVVGDPDQLRQVVLSLALNAVQSMPEGGTLKVTLRVQGEDALLEISDTGRGVAPENVERIFDPFFTTRSDAVGLGLAIGYAICKRHGGTLELVPAGPPGSLFRMRLPRAPSPGRMPIIPPG